jgi:hypothetical protein
MTLWFRRAQGLDSETLRESADNAGVSWDYQPILYRGNGIGYKNGDSDDAEVIQDCCESIVGYRPVEISPPSESGNTTQ